MLPRQNFGDNLDRIAAMLSDAMEHYDQAGEDMGNDVWAEHLKSQLRHTGSQTSPEIDVVVLAMTNIYRLETRGHL